MNATRDWNFCLGLQPTWAPSDHDSSVDLLIGSNIQAQSYCPQLETYVKQTVPCPPPTKPCLFWAVANNTSLTSWDVQLVATACGVPSFSHCINSSISEEPRCTPMCLALVVCFLLLVVSLIIVAYCSLRRQKRSLSELCSTGVCICIDKVVIKKIGLNRTESCSPTLAENWSTPEIRRTGSVNSGYINSDITLDWQKDRVEYLHNSEENDPGEEDPDRGIVPNAELKPHDSTEEGSSVYSGQSPAPDVVTMASHTQDRLSYC